ncbi:hypothetical protein EV359DRAFT_44052, partial [Lentinula novae-zelandiae]
EYRNLTLKCAAEIANLPRSDISMYDAKLKIFFMSVMTTIDKLIPPSTDIASAYANASDAGQEMVVALALFLVNFFSKHLPIMEGDADREVLINAHFYLIKISQVDEREIFKICLEYWLIPLVGLYDEVSMKPLGTDRGRLKLRKDIYRKSCRIFSTISPAHTHTIFLPYLGLSREVVRVYLQETDTIVLHKSIRELMVCLTHLDIVNAEMILTQKMAAQIDGSEWSWGNSNMLCWAIGSISHAMDEDTKRRFLGLIKQKCSQDNIVMIAANIMYVVGQYPRFLKAHWRFLKTVVNKLFEFMHETHESAYLVSLCPISLI